MQISHGEPHGRPTTLLRALASPWFAIGGVFFVALLLVWGVEQIHERGNEDVRAALALNALEAAGHELQALKWQAFSRDGNDTSALAQMEQTYPSLAHAFDSVQRHTRQDARMRSVEDRYRRYDAAVRLTFDLLTRGDLDGARRAAGEQLDPTFDALHGDITAASHAYVVRSRSVDEIADIGGVAVTAISLGSVVAVVWHAERLRRRAALQDAEHAALERSEARFRALVLNSTDLLVLVDGEGKLRYASPSNARILGYDPEEHLGASIFTFMHPDDAALMQPVFAAVAAVPGVHPPSEFRVRHADGSWRWLEATATNLLHDPAVGAIVENCRDITERKLLQSELTRQAFTDALTGLPNRALFLDRLEHATASFRGRRDARHLAVLIIDLDRFKTVNDSLGHLAGDRLLIAQARRLASCLGPGDTIARLGGDEFAVLLENIEPDEALATAERLVEALREPLPLSGHDLIVSASAGVVVAVVQDQQPGDFLRDADVALYHAKAAGRGRAVAFAPEMNAHALERLHLEADLRGAIDRGELRVHYQPLIDLATGRVRGAEALVRWEHPRRGLIPPAGFIPLAEETGLIVAIDRWVLREACRQAAVWRRRFGDPQFVIGVNLTAEHFCRPDLLVHVRAALGNADLDPSGLQIEITETAMMANIEQAIGVIEQLRALGVGVALDDFGTGYSSLGYLRRLPLDVLKVDRCFVSELENAEVGEAQAIVQSVTQLGHALGMEIVAEGIETAVQLAGVRALGCDTGQGFYFATPLTAGEFGAILERDGTLRLSATG